MSKVLIEAYQTTEELKAYLDKNPQNADTYKDLMRLACEGGRLDVVEFLADRVRVTYHDPYPVLVAARCGQQAIVEYFLTSGSLAHHTAFSPALVDKLLVKAVQGQHTHLVEYLVNSFEVDVHAEDEASMSVCALDGLLGIAKILFPKAQKLSNELFTFAYDYERLNILEYMILEHNFERRRSVVSYVKTHEKNIQSDVLAIIESKRERRKLDKNLRAKTAAAKNFKI